MRGTGHDRGSVGSEGSAAGSGRSDGGPATVVVGLGVMGSAAAAALARRGASVVGLDRFHPPHGLGSSHGESRMIRQAYYEAPIYVPLVQRAWRAWRRLERRAGRRLLRRTGGLMIGPEDGTLLPGIRASAGAHGLEIEEVAAPAVARRFPPFRLPEDRTAIVERRAGYLHAERCVEALLEDARTAGAELRFGERVVDWEADDRRVEVTTDRGTYRGERLVLAAGPWMPTLAGDLSLSFAIERQVQLWFAPRADRTRAFRPDRCPVFLWETEPGEFWYGFPEVEEGVKVARHHGGRPCAAETVDRTVGESDVEPVRRLLRAGLPDAAGELLRGSVCLYTDTPDGHFRVDHHPASRRVVIASPCSGHGFKFAPVIGRMAADLVLDGGSDLRPDAFVLEPSP